MTNASSAHTLKVGKRRWSEFGSGRENIKEGMVTGPDLNVYVGVGSIDDGQKGWK